MGLPLPVPEFIPIDDVEDPRLADYLNQRDAHLRARHLSPDLADATGTGMPAGLFMAEGKLVLQTLIRVSQMARPAYAVRSVLLRPESVEALRPDLDQLSEATPIYIIGRELMARIVGFDIHRGILAVGEFRSPWSPAEVIAASQTLVVLEDSANHDNVGSIFRSCSCLAHLPPEAPAGVLLSPGCCDPLYRKALRVSMGHVLEVPFAVLEPWPNGLDRVRNAGFEVLALTPGPGSMPIQDLPAGSRKRCLLLGAEGPGLTKRAMEIADRKVRIPMRPGVDSLNVGIAGAIAMQRIVAISEKAGGVQATG